MQRTFHPVVCVALATLAAACTASGPTATRTPATFVLSAVGDRPVPVALSATPNGGVTSVVEGTLRFDDLGGSGGLVTGSETLLVADPGAAPVSSTRALTGRSTRRGDTVTVAFATGASSAFLLEDGGASLRTIGAACGPNPCDAVLHAYVFRRASGSP